MRADQEGGRGEKDERRRKKEDGRRKEGRMKLNLLMSVLTDDSSKRRAPFWSVLKFL